MDKTKQPGIKCDSIILAESIFKRKPLIPDKQEMEIVFDIKNSITGDNKKLITEVTAVINNEESAIFAKVTYVGIFSAENENNMELTQFSKTNAPAIIFPYIREEVHNRMQKGGLPKPLIIPPINIIALTNSSKCE